MSLPVEPVLHTEAGDFLEVHEVAAEEVGVVGDADSSHKKEPPRPLLTGTAIVGTDYESRLS